MRGAWAALTHRLDVHCGELRGKVAQNVRDGDADHACTSATVAARHALSEVVR